MSHAGQGGIGVCMVVLLGRDRLPRRRGHGLRFGVPPVRLPGREHREAARGALPGPALSRARVVVLQRRLAGRCRAATAGTPRRVGDQGGCGRGTGGARVPGRRARAGTIDGEWLSRWLAPQVHLPDLASA